MSAEDVLAVLALARAAEARVWLGGGWGVDALAGEQTRPHRDVDLCHRSRDEPRLLAALAGAGYVQTLDARPVRFVLSGPAGREIDLHPLEFAADGSALQSSFDPASPFCYPADCFTSGTVAGTAVPCVSAAQQVYFHRGYEPADRDRHDMRLLRERFGVVTPY
ncbi:nucleotidyltransferase domain-containing protein [Streptomyces sp. NRRL F-5126]|uniref:nucleotidyltransferase domain-containing protein n=1 Tax=Streptomyces sp. NRRL F-5126 TaxID=1463857 RepID=UPI0004C9247C|nr:amino acid transporter [Streptomyces sp. NRRL F-5126]